MGDAEADIRTAYETLRLGGDVGDARVRSIVRESWSRSMRRGVDPAMNAVKEAVQGLPQREDVHSETGLPVLRLKTTTP